MPRKHKCKANGCDNTVDRTYRSTAQVCSSLCALALVREKEARKAAKKAKSDRRETKARKIALMSVRDWIKKAQPVFNKYIRLRDKDKPCISCGRTNQEVEGSEGWKPGGSWDCGHFLTIGAHEELRFEPKNAYKQCKSCNGGSGKYTKKNHTVGKQYRINLIERVGIETVDWLEGPHVLPRWTTDDIKAVQDKYKTKIKELENELSNL